MILHSIRGRDKVRAQMMQRFTQFLADCANNQIQDLSVITTMRLDLRAAYEYDGKKPFYNEKIDS